MKFTWKKCMAALLLAFVLAGSLFANPVEFVGLRNFGIIGGRNVSLRISARGRQTVSYGVTSRVGGVLFQEVAVPAAGAEGKPVGIEYRPDRPDGQRLIVTIGDAVVTADLYDWQLIPTARFAATSYTACMSLLGRPKTQAELVQFFENPGSIMFAEFHPDLANTLAGINLFFVDAMLVDGNISRMRQITDSLSGLVPGYNDISIEENESAAGAAFIRRLLIANADNWDNYIFTDYGTEIRYEITNGKLIFTGFPSYLFMLSDDNTETVTINRELNALIRRNIQRVRSINPVVYRAAEQTAQLAAFFRMVKEQHPAVWEDFTAQISGAEDGLRIETPRYWIRSQ
jgi:hypothetical protein